MTFMVHCFIFWYCYFDIWMSFSPLLLRIRQASLRTCRSWPAHSQTRRSSSYSSQQKYWWWMHWGNSALFWQSDMTSNILDNDSHRYYNDSLTDISSHEAGWPTPAPLPAHRSQLRYDIKCHHKLTRLRSLCWFCPGWQVTSTESESRALDHAPLPQSKSKLTSPDDKGYIFLWTLCDLIFLI